MANVAPPGLSQFFDDNGNPAAAYKLYTYDAGTTTPRSTWTSSGESVANANPVILDANGRAQIFYRGNYKLELRTPADAVVWTQDNFNVPDPNASNSIVFANGSAATPSVRFAQATSSGLFSPASNVVAMSVNGAEVQRWSAGNVGIGGTPTQKLDVFGSSRLQGAVTITTGGLTVTAGGVTVSAGGATITGNSSVAGNLTVTAGTLTSRGFTDLATASSWNIDASGRWLNNAVTQPGFSATRSTNVALGSGATVVFDTENRDVGACYNNGTGRFTAPVAGTYVIQANVNQTTTSAANGHVDMRKNGSSDICSSYWRAEVGTITTGTHVGTVVYLAASDYIEVIVTFDVATTILAGSTFSAQLIG